MKKKVITLSIVTLSLLFLCQCVILSSILFSKEQISSDTILAEGEVGVFVKDGKRYLKVADDWKTFGEPSKPPKDVSFKTEVEFWTWCASGNYKTPAMTDYVQKTQTTVFELPDFDRILHPASDRLGTSFFSWDPRGSLHYEYENGIVLTINYITSETHFQTYLTGALYNVKSAEEITLQNLFDPKVYNDSAILTEYMGMPALKVTVSGGTYNGFLYLQGYEFSDREYVIITSAKDDDTVILRYMFYDDEHFYIIDTQAQTPEELHFIYGLLFEQTAYGELI